MKRPLSAADWIFATLFILLSVWLIVLLGGL